MPIRVTCQCGQSLNVPDTMAGKSGKCPKCQQLLQVPASNSGSPAAGAPAKKPAPKSAQGATPSIGVSKSLDSIFDQAGLKHREGNFCPVCDAVVQPGAVICVKCGLNFAEGTKLDAHQVASKGEFGNKRLNEAVKMMEREEETQKRLLSSGTPWWFMLAALAGLIVFLAGALIKMDSITSGEFSSNAMMSRIQKADILVVLIASLGSACVLVATLATWAIIFTAFTETTKCGLMCMFVPFYILYYMFSRITTHRLFSTVMIYWITAIIGTVCLIYSFPKI